VASKTADIGKLEELMTLGGYNGLADLEIVDRSFVRKREPYVEAIAAIWSPTTGIVETESFVRALFQHAIRNGVATLLNTRLQTGTAEKAFVVINTERETFGARVIINAAGLFADEVSKLLGGDKISIWPIRGNYAELAPSARYLVQGLVYPLPDPTGHGLGVHATRTTRGNVTLGPTACVQKSKHDYESDRRSTMPQNHIYPASRWNNFDRVLVEYVPGGALPIKNFQTFVLIVTPKYRAYSMQLALIRLA